MTWNIRVMNESDIDNVYAIETAAHVAPWSRNVLRDCVLVGYNCLVLEIRKEDKWILAGYVICRHYKHVCHILNFCIARDFQLKGYGRQLLQHVLNCVEELYDIHEVTLEVRPSNKVALHLYQSLGFKQIEIKRAYYKNNEKTEDAIFFKKTLR